MTETEWLACTDPRIMLHVIDEKGLSERKVRLFNAAICRRFWGYLPEASQVILVESELLADGLIPSCTDEMELCGRANAVVAPFDRLYPTKRFPNEEVRIQRGAAAAVCYAVIPNELFGAISYFWDIKPAEKDVHVVLICDVFGNPLCPLTISPTVLAWNDGLVVRLAQVAYEERHLPAGTLDNTRLAILADALEEAGCTDAEILDHLRGPGPHVRGCFAVDLCLGKS